MLPLLKRVYTQLLQTLFPPRQDERLFLSENSEHLYSKLPPAEHDQVLEELCASACFAYKDQRVRALIRLLKYRGNTHIIQLCAKALEEELLEILADAALFDAVAVPLLVPIPLSPERLRERGFNQSHRLAEALLSQTTETIDYAPYALTRVHTHRPQAHTQSKAARLKAMQNVFTAQASLVQNRDVLLLDDVITTGATLRDASRALHQAGARHIYCITLAH